MARCSDTTMEVIKLTRKANRLARCVTVNVRFKQAVQDGRFEEAESVARALIDQAMGVLFRAYLMAEERHAVLMVRQSMEYMQICEKHAKNTIKEAMR